MTKHLNNILFTHSGGVTSVVNTVASVIHERAQADQRQMYIARYGIDGIIASNWFKSTDVAPQEWSLIANSPGSAFGSSRKRLPTDKGALEKIFQQFEKDSIGTFFCNGGNNSQHITHIMQQTADELGYPLRCIGIPKTIDNDLYHTDTCPGFGSAAKYTATSVFEMSLDLAAMCHSSTQILIYESMGRDTGWLAASSALARQSPQGGPHIILVPEADFSLHEVIAKIKQLLQTHKHCVICIAEGAVDRDKQLLSGRHTHKSLNLHALITAQLGVKSHVVLPDYLQRSARHIASQTDVEQTIALSQHAYSLALDGKGGCMTTIKRQQSLPYQWTVSSTPLDKVAGKCRMLPKHFLTEDQLYVSDSCIQYLQPLIMGQADVNYHKGIPQYSQLIYKEDCQ